MRNANSNLEWYTLESKFYFVRLLMRMMCVLALVTCAEWGHAQDEKKTFTKRILFILDGSGSMNQSWQKESKWEMAVSTLSNLIDSFENADKDFEIGIRVLGHQYPKSMQKCEDTKLEIDFSSHLTYDIVHQTLRRIVPQGQTPLAYSIAQSERDFRGDMKAQNIIILITDGLENCDGNPCEVAQRLKEKNIFINPYIIGLGIDSLESHKLECIGKFIDAKSKSVFRDVVKTILTEVKTKTTMTIQFIKSDSSLVPFYVPFSLIDKKSKADIHSFVYTSTTKKNLDTIAINPQYQYELWVHSNPPFQVEHFQIIKGTHQHVIVPIVAGYLEYSSPEKNRKNLYFLRDRDLQKTIWHQNFTPLVYRESPQLYLDMIQLPTITKSISQLREDQRVFIPPVAKGTLSIKKESQMMATIFNQKWEKIITMDSDILNTFEILAGDYYVLYKLASEPSEKSKFQSFRIIENQTTQILIP